MRKKIHNNIKPTEPNIRNHAELSEAIPSIAQIKENVEGALIQPVIRQKSRFNWNSVTAVASTVALIFLAIAAFYNAAQLETAHQIAQAQSVMEYFKLLQDFNDIQLKLVDGGEWSMPGTGPKTPEEWFRVRRYMGLLEQIEVLVDSKVISLEVADGNYSHRIRAIYNNDLIRQKDLEEQVFRWQRFLKLVKRLETMPVYQGLRKRDESNKV